MAGPGVWGDIWPTDPLLSSSSAACQQELMARAWRGEMAATDALASDTWFSPLITVKHLCARVVAIQCCARGMVEQTPPKRGEGSQQLCLGCGAGL